MLNNEFVTKKILNNEIENKIQLKMSQVNSGQPIKSRS
jgi:hypothetical protein